MVSLHYPKHFRAVQRLPFCYLCEQPFEEGDKTDRDHVPPQALFARADRMPLILRTHVKCNGEHKLTDEKMGQLIGLRRGAVPSDPKNRKLLYEMLGGRRAAITNVDVHSAVWRWIRGFHAALYHEPLPLMCQRAIELPFQRARRSDAGSLEAVPLREQQHRKFVEVLKVNRAKGNLDRVITNSGKLRYECVWAQNSGSGEWGCIFGLDVYAWKDLGDPGLIQRGCAGVYALPSGQAPPTASKRATTPIVIPNLDPLDPFGH